MSERRPRVLVTGGAHRVGRATLLELARCGCDLFTTWKSSEDAAQRTLEDARRAAADAGHSIDVGSHELDLDDLDAVAELGGRLGLVGIDGVVHNASLYAATPLDELDAASIEMHLRVNAIAPVLLTRAILPSLRTSVLPAGGSVVCFGDIHVMGRPRRNFLAYSMSKAAFMQAVDTLAIELAPSIRVNAIAPGVVAWPADADRDEVEAYEARIPLARPGTPEDAARTVRWLLFEAAYVTGQTIRVDGGRWLR